MTKPDTVARCRVQTGVESSQRGGSSGIWPPPVLGGRLDVPSSLPNFVEQKFGALGCIERCIKPGAAPCRR